jgi:hypothetical protein
MIRWTVAISVGFAVLVLLVPPAAACSLCQMDLQRTQTLRQEAALPSARLILYGTLHDPRINPSRTTLKIKHVLRSDPVLGNAKEIDIPRYLPFKDVEPPRYLVFCDVFMGKIDPIRDLRVKDEAAVSYLQKVLALDPKDRIAQLRFYFGYLEHPDEAIARDAFLEFAKATDAEIGKVAGSLQPERLRFWLKEKRRELPAERLSLYAYLLGACGGPEDVSLLGGLLGQTNEDKIGQAYDGILSGYLHLQPREGWERVLNTLRDSRVPLQQRLSTVRTVQFVYGTQPEKYRTPALQAFRTMLVQGDLADMAVENLRKNKLWDLTDEVLSVYGKKGYDAPIMQRALLRYALSCPRSDRVADFVAARRKEDPETFKEVEDSLRFDMRP